ncbi:hypothetical protein [Polaribacter uvawellassae]|uniref:hypothetical protein n=1 Tax=Polaribacter uvawellassae TaxID=3133495 RepID=UPI00321A0C0B
MNIRLKIIFLVLNLVTVLNLNSQIASVFNDFKFGDSINIVQKELSKISDFIKVIEISKPKFPLAKHTETHLLAYKIRIKSKTLEKAVFTFSDNRLCYIEAKGNVLKVFGENRNDKPQNFLGYQVFTNDLLFINKKEDTAWILTPESTHPNLFTWNNPLLIDSNKSMNYNTSVKIPEFIEMGGSLKNELTKFEKESQIIQVDDLDGSDPNAQIQVNAYGIEYAGFPRKFEARFGNDKLNMIWILTSNGEEDRIRKKLIKEYGKPIFININWEFFHNWTVALRKDKPEVLFLTKELGMQYKKRLNN